MNDIAIDKEHLHYLEQLSEMYPTIGKASSEIINLQAILNLPKGTEHFVSDVHGEYEAFSHVLKNGSGAVRKKIDDVFGLAMTRLRLPHSSTTQGKRWSLLSRTSRIWIRGIRRLFIS